ncbi:MAG: hypothetical protein SF052_08960 [Bacteroidia bacterium]|nr:hypothetical protein [Bacteroidia bacterium]
MAVSYISPSLPTSVSSSNILAIQLKERHGLSPESDRDATNTLLMIQAVANISGWKMEAEFERLHEIIRNYQSLSREIRELATEEGD